jgi:hypothetical protein
MSCLLVSALGSCSRWSKPCWQKRYIDALRLFSSPTTPPSSTPQAHVRRQTVLRGLRDILPDVQRHVLELDLDDVLARPGPSFTQSTAFSDSSNTDIANPSWVLPACPAQRPPPQSLADTYSKPTPTSSHSGGPTAAGRPVPLSASSFLRSGPVEVRRSDAVQSSVKKTISAVSRLGTQSPFVRQLTSTGTSGGTGGQPNNVRRVSSPMRASPFPERSDKARSDATRESYQTTSFPLKLQKERDNGSPLKSFSGQPKSMAKSPSPKAPRQSLPGFEATRIAGQTTRKKGKAQDLREDVEMKPVKAGKKESREVLPGGFPGEEDEEKRDGGEGRHDVEMREASTSPVTRKRAHASAHASALPRRSARLNEAVTKDPGQGGGDNRKGRRRTKK